MLRSATTVNGSESQFVSVPLNKLFLVRGFAPELYVRLGDSRFVKIVHSLEDLSETRRNWYREKGVQELFLDRNDYEQFLALQQTLASRIHRVGDIAGQKKVAFAVSALEMVMTEVFRGPGFGSLDEQRLLQVTDVVMTSVQLVLKHVQLVDVLRALREVQPGILGHSISVAFHAVLIGHELGWRSSRTQLHLVLSGLLHEIGKLQLSPKLLNRPLETLSPSEREELDLYPELGAQLLRQIRGIPETVVQAVALHRQDSRFKAGRGGQRKSRVNRFARIIGLCDDFVELNQLSLEGHRVKPAVALRALLKDSSRYDRLALRALVQIYSRAAQVDQKRKVLAA